uniref:Major facilitator superfamily (MFS) profile domain-containing protein n=1 Tax=Bicosoecida sp. CB-2014 TaxID=1486930 RepID=A0A7S1CDR4_9STRA|mmetsp:Transcript_23071/g.80426  ORF Transcript_23071/g.80426 Transcript_23071/m.80426 type:complete len:482 (+) Transcript_23071:195-1640(+)
MADSGALLTADGRPAPAHSGEGKPPRFYMTSLVIMSLSFFLVYTAFSAIQNLSGEYVGHAGSTSVSVLYFVFAASCIGGPAVVDYLGQRWSLFTAFVFIALFCVANWIAVGAGKGAEHDGLKYAVLVPTGALLGFGASFLWTAQGSYLTTASEHYSIASGRPSKAALGTFNGVFWGFFQLTQLSGNLLEPLVSDATDDSTSAVFLVYAAFAVAGTVLIIFLPSIGKVKQSDKSAPDRDATSSSLQIESTEEEEEKTTMQKFADVIGLWTDRRFVWFLPAILLSGFEQGFIWNDFTTYYIPPVLGKKDIGYVMAVFGASDAVASVSMGKISDAIGRAPVLTIGFAAQCLVILLFIVHGAPEDGTTEPFWTWGGGWGSLIVAAVLWGIGDAVWNTQISALLGDVFSADTGPAFANFKLWQSLSIAASFLYNQHLGIVPKQLIVYLSLCIGYVCARMASIKAAEANAAAEAKLRKYKTSATEEP